jgi:hypothetical protein
MPAMVVRFNAPVDPSGVRVFQQAPNSTLSDR